MITATQVNELRQRTGISMMDCKKALEASGGDEENAIEFLRKKGLAKASEKASRETKEGLVLTKVIADKAVIVAQYSETDFVSQNEEFKAIAAKAVEDALSSGVEAANATAEVSIKELFTKLGENMSIKIQVIEGKGIGAYVHTNGKVGALVLLATPDVEKARDVAMHVTAMKPVVIHPQDLSEEVIAKERVIWSEQLKNEGKPEAIHAKIMEGKEKKFREEAALMTQAFIKDNEKTIQQYLNGNDVKAMIRVNI